MKSSPLFIFTALVLNFFWSEPCRPDTTGVLFVGGSFSEYDSALFGTQKKMLDHSRIPWVQAPIRSTRGFLENSPLLIKEMDASSWDHYLIVSHSLGGLATLDAILTNQTLQNRLSGWISYQAPFFGSSTTDLATTWYDLYDPLRLRRYFFPDAFGVSDHLSIEERRDYMEKWADEIADLTGTKRVVCVTASVPGSSTDLIVDRSSMLLPGALEIYATASHLDLIDAGRGDPEQQEDVFERARESL